MRLFIPFIGFDTENNALLGNTVDEYPIVVSQFEKNYMHLKAVRGIDFAVRKGMLN